MIPDLGRYAFEVALSYVVTLALLAGLVGLSVMQGRATRRKLDAAEARASRDG